MVEGLTFSAAQPRAAASKVRKISPCQRDVEVAPPAGIEFTSDLLGAPGTAGPDHIFATRPDLVRRYGTHLWLDPGEPEVMDHTVAVILDVVRRYDIDGVWHNVEPRDRESGDVMLAVMKKISSLDKGKVLPLYRQQKVGF